MRKRRCPEPECYHGTVWDEQTGEELSCPKCGGTGIVENPDWQITQFKDLENIRLAAGFLQALRENPYDEDLHRIYADWLEEHGELTEAAYQRAWTPELQEAEDWMDDYALQCEVTREEILKAGEAYLDEGDGYCIGTDTPDIVWTGREDFWRHFSVLTGREVPAAKKADTFIRCAC